MKKDLKVVIVSLMVCFYLVLAGSMIIKRIDSKSTEKEEMTAVKQHSVAVVETETFKELTDIDAEEEHANSINPIFGFADADEYLRNKKFENLQYVNEVTEYCYEDYVFTRFENFVSVHQDETDSIYLSGYDFILTNDGTVWFVNQDRMVSSYTCNTGETVVYESADIDFHVENWYRDNKYMQINGSTAITKYEFPYTVVISNDTVEVYGDKYYEPVYFPFNIREIASTENYSWGENEEYINFCSDTGVVGQLIFTADGVDYNIIDATESEKSLYFVEGNRVDTRGNWVVYYKDKELVASDGELTFSFDEMDYREMWLGDCCGLGKGYENFAAVLIPVDDYEAFDTMSIEELLDIYVM